MHKLLVNRAKLTLQLQPDGPLLIKGGEGLHLQTPSLPDMAFVRTNGGVYLPGSSLKGVIRSHCEMIARSFQAEPPLAWALTCDPVGADHCGAISEHEELLKVGGASAYRHSCFVCQLFGNTYLASHARFADAMPAADTVKLEERNGVAIDRVFGSVAVGPFQFETLVAGVFTVTIELQNFTGAHLGLLLLALRDLKDQHVRLGFGKSRGLGRVKAELQKLELTSMRATPGSTDFDVCFPGPRDEAGYLPRTLQDATTPIPLGAPAGEGDWGAARWIFKGEAAITTVVPPFIRQWLQVARLQEVA